MNSKRRSLPQRLEVACSIFFLHNVHVKISILILPVVFIYGFGLAPLR